MRCCLLYVSIEETICWIISPVTTEQFTIVDPEYFLVTLTEDTRQREMSCSIRGTYPKDVISGCDGRDELKPLTLGTHENTDFLHPVPTWDIRLINKEFALFSKIIVSTFNSCANRFPKEEENCANSYALRKENTIIIIIFFKKKLRRRSPCHSIISLPQVSYQFLSNPTKKLLNFSCIFM